MNTQAACCTLRGISLENNTYKISNRKYCHISQKVEFARVIQLCKKLDGITNINASVSEETPPPCGLFKLYMPPKSSISLTMEENMEASRMCNYCFVACRTYVTLALPSFPKQLVSPSALSSGLLLKVHGFQLVQEDEFY